MLVLHERQGALDLLVLYERQGALDLLVLYERQGALDFTQSVAKFQLSLPKTKMWCRERHRHVKLRNRPRCLGVAQHYHLYTRGIAKVRWGLVFRHVYATCLVLMSVQISCKSRIHIYAHVYTHACTKVNGRSVKRFLARATIRCSVKKNVVN